MSDNWSEVEHASDSRATSPSRDPRWYLEEDNVEIQAGSTLFRVPSYALYRASEVFRTLSDTRSKIAGESLPPITVPNDIAAEDLRCFLEILHPMPPVFGVYPLQSSAEWISVLHLAHFFQLESVKTLAIKQLDATACAVDKIICAMKYGVERWLPATYVDACASPDPPTREEADRLGMDTYWRIMTARDKARRLVHNARRKMEEIVEAVFNLEAGPASLRAKEMAAAAISETSSSPETTNSPGGGSGSSETMDARDVPPVGSQVSVTPTSIITSLGIEKLVSPACLSSATTPSPIPAVADDGLALQDGTLSRDRSAKGKRGKGKPPARSSWIFAEPDPEPTDPATIPRRGTSRAMSMERNRVGEGDGKIVNETESF
ncbi:hypothetical protein PUNSTDRAFT_134244 [Punctularia strigosozonata HHB-11173 SS5]|uniref:uncharacterized protein n=1 Tax=Punctularia strigosozonata (strain HHB-11173) TaxID=741275 RepID=UPI00044181CC|nr:uncharacterized protein PUNSTDRAFT_134244 [Punctularia strigosozonata HHB-11173 SS5]EIN09071.1 hypothetical protein PUNSTDRAFT_134244 [Punctularia strigosozonata HHB-11173 SS5]